MFVKPDKLFELCFKLSDCKYGKDRPMYHYRSVIDEMQLKGITVFDGECYFHVSCVFYFGWYVIHRMLG